MFEIEFSKQSVKDIRKLASQLQKLLLSKVFPYLSEDYTVAKKLKAKLRDIYSYGFNFKKTEYRIAFEVINESQKLLILMVGTRENFYDRLHRRIGK